MLPCRHDTETLKCLGHCFSATEAALKIAALEGAGFAVFAPWFTTISNLPHYAFAYGGIPLMVPHDQAKDAMALLLAIEQENEGPAECVQRPTASPMSKNSLLRWLFGLFMFYAGVAPGLNDTFLNSDRHPAQND